MPARTSRPSRAGENLFHPPDHPEWGFAGYVRHFIDKPTIAAVNGTALGGGTELALASDLVVAEERAKFGLPEVKRGLIAGAGGVFRIVAQLPQKLALELVYTGEPLSSADALKWGGLINKVVPDGTVVEAALELAERIAVNAPLAVRASKRVSYGAVDGVVAADEPFWKQTFGEFATLLKTEDAQEVHSPSRRSANPSGKRSNEEAGFRNRTRAVPGDRQAVPGKGVPANVEKWEANRLVDREAYVAAGNYGLIGFNMPEEYGGGGVDDFRFNAVIVEEFSKFGLACPSLTLQNDIVGPYFTNLATEEQLKRWMPGFASGELIGAIAMSEPGAGSDLAGIRTTAVRDGDDWIINGSKTFISAGINSDLVIVVARTDPEAGHKGFSLLVVERDMPGFTRGPQARQDRSACRRHRRAELRGRPCPGHQLAGCRR